MKKRSGPTCASERLHLRDWLPEVGSIGFSCSGQMFFLHHEGWFCFTLFVCLGGSAGYLIKLQTDLHYVLSTQYFCSGLNIRGTIKSNRLWCWSGICIKLAIIIHDYLTKRDMITWLNFITDITWWHMRLLHSLMKYMRWGWNLQKQLAAGHWVEIIFLHMAKINTPNHSGM